MGQVFMVGNKAVAWGAYSAGCRFFAGYPITPATTIYNTMLDLLPPVGGVCLQGEDEIASMGFCIGASMAGLKVMTATSGPGISLYSEQISFAIGSEIPMVIVDVQRLGPSTGSATRGADGDVQFLQWGNSGGVPVIVLAPVDVRDCWELTAHAFNLAERLRCPVFVASNKEIGMTRETIDLDQLQLPEIEDRRLAPTHKPYVPFETRSGQDTPDFLPLGADQLVRQNASTHGADGFITADPTVIAASQTRLKRKIESQVEALTFYESQLRVGADTLIIAYGVTARAVQEAARRMSAEGKPVSVLILKTLWPVPEFLIRDVAADHLSVWVIEMNLGQYVREIERLVAPEKVHFYGQMNGDLISPKQIMEAVSHG